MTSKLQLFKIKLKGGSPWGFRLQGGSGTGLPLTVAKVRRKSKAYNTLKEGDHIIRVNDAICNTLTYEQVMTLAERSGDELKIEVERKGSRTENAVAEIVKPTESPTPKTVLSNDALPTAKSSQKERTVSSKVTEKVDVKELKMETLTKTDVPNLPDPFPDLKQPDPERKDPFSELIDPFPELKLPDPERKDTFPELKDPFPELKDPFPELKDPFPERKDPFPDLKVADTFIISENIGKVEDKLGRINNISESPQVISDISVRTSSEITPSTEKREKLETEKFHEKSGNKETTFIRTDFEESTKSSTSSTLPDLPKEASGSEHIPNAESKIKEISTKKITSESYEVFKTEKTQITTTKKCDTTPNFESKGHQSELFTEKNTVQELVKNLPSLDADIMASLNFNDIFSTSDADSDSMSLTKKKKMFSSSSFYEEPRAIYPTVEEQFEMAKKIAESLADDTNKKSKGANMFFKRAMRSPKWVTEGPEPSNETFPRTYGDFPGSVPQTNGNGKQPQSLKLVLDPRHDIDLASLRSTGQNISEHNVVSPNVCHELIRGLESPLGKGGALFAKRKKKSSEWVVDEERVKSMMRAQEQDLSQIKENINTGGFSNTGVYMSQWDNYLKSTSKVSGAPSKCVNPDKLAETVIKAADIKRRDSIQSLPDEQFFETCRSPIIPATPAASYYDIYRARAPKGWSGAGSTTPNMDAMCSSPISQHAGYAEVNSMATHTLASYSFPKKYKFQNFNTVPRKWKTQH